MNSPTTSTEVNNAETTRRRHQQTSPARSPAVTVVPNLWVNYAGRGVTGTKIWGMEELNKKYYYYSWKN